MANINAGPFTTRPEIVGTFGVVATTHWIATAVARSMLERGGKAFDAGVAAAFTPQVVEPHLCGPGRDWRCCTTRTGAGPSLSAARGPLRRGRRLPITAGISVSTSSRNWPVAGVHPRHV